MVVEIALDILKSDLSGSLQMKDLGSHSHLYFYLREAFDFLPALNLKR